VFLPLNPLIKLAGGGGQARWLCNAGRGSYFHLQVLKTLQRERQLGASRDRLFGLWSVWWYIADMCLGIPMRLAEMGEGGRAIAENDGLRLEVDVSLIEDPRPGEYVIVHAGFAIERLDLEEAEARLAIFERLGQVSTDGVSSGQA